MDSPKHCPVGRAKARIALSCARCGRLTDPGDEAAAELSALVDGLARRTGHMVDEVSLDLRGLCQDCRQACCQD